MSAKRARLILLIVGGLALLAVLVYQVPAVQDRLSWRVDIALTLGSGKRVVVGSLVEGDLMALSALIPPFHLSASGIAKENGKLIQIKAAELRALLEDNPELGYNLMKGIAKGLMGRLQDTRVELAGQSVDK